VADEEQDEEQEEQEEEPLARAEVDDITAGTSTSGVGGPPVGEEPDVGAATEGTGLDQVVQQAERAGWGRDPYGSDS
jgi:hypothetical protein